MEMAGAFLTVGSVGRTEVFLFVIFFVAPYLSQAHQSGLLDGCFLLIAKVRQSLSLSPQNSPAKAMG